MTYLPPSTPGPKLKIDMGLNMPRAPEGSKVFGLTPESRRETRWAGGGNDDKDDEGGDVDVSGEENDSKK